MSIQPREWLTDITCQRTLEDSKRANETLGTLARTRKGEKIRVLLQTDSGPRIFRATVVIPHELHQPSNVTIKADGRTLSSPASYPCLRLA